MMVLKVSHAKWRLNFCAKFDIMKDFSPDTTEFIKVLLMTSKASFSLIVVALLLIFFVIYLNYMYDIQLFISRILYGQ